jgi:hypothetical protein
MDDRKIEKSPLPSQPIHHLPLVIDLFVMRSLSKCTALRKRSSFFDSRSNFGSENVANRPHQ